LTELKEYFDCAMQDLGEKENLILHFTSLGASTQTVLQILGISQQEFDAVLAVNPKLKRAIEIGKATGACRSLNVLCQMVESGRSLDAIKYHLSLLDKSYAPDTGKGATVNVNNNTLSIRLPTVAEAREIIDADPSLLPSQESESL
jgi:hypothetical protein